MPSTVIRIKLILLALFGAFVAFVVALVACDSPGRKLGEYVSQPIAFSHKHHVGDVGLDCRFCRPPMTFFPQFLLGYQGMPRRYHAYPPEYEFLNVLSSAGASILAIGYLLPMLYFAWSVFRGKGASANPWGAIGLEWQTASPPPTHNFQESPIAPGDVYGYMPIYPPLRGSAVEGSGEPTR